MGSSINDIIKSHPELEDEIREWRWGITKKIALALIVTYAFGSIFGWFIRGVFL